MKLRRSDVRGEPQKDYSGSPSTEKAVKVRLEASVEAVRAVQGGNANSR